MAAHKERNRSIFVCKLKIEPQRKMHPERRLFTGESLVRTPFTGDSPVENIRLFEGLRCIEETSDSHKALWPVTWPRALIELHGLIEKQEEVLRSIFAKLKGPDGKRAGDKVQGDRVRGDDFRANPLDAIALHRQKRYSL